MEWICNFIRAVRQQLCACFGCGEQGSHLLLVHFIVSLRDEVLYALHPSNEAPVNNTAIADRVQTLLAIDDQPTWERAYEIERLLVYLRPRRRLLIEVDRRVAEARTAGMPQSAQYRAQLDKNQALIDAAAANRDAAESAVAKPPAGADTTQLASAQVLAEQQLERTRQRVDDERRAILAAVLDDLQWHYQKTNLIRRAMVRSARSIGWFGLLAVLACGVPFFVFVFERYTGKTYFSNLIDHFPNYGLYTAVSFGLLGSFFSRLVAFNANGVKSVEEAENRYNFRSLLVRGGVGMCGAIILYYLLRTNIVGTLIAPDLSKLSYDQMDNTVTMLSSTKFTVLVPSRDWCLLVIWSFLAGFSEQLVPDTLARSQAQMTGVKAASAPTPPAAQPAPPTPPAN